MDLPRTDVVRGATAIAALAQDHERVVTHCDAPQLHLLAAQSTADAALTTPIPWICSAPRPRG
ncbi:hypothetical protein AB0C70_25450 [Streptomyces sp. NPDC048564]|uniref:hypothetical protein n=1 Tax=unclassified Streptomyces TaxID=2593676 RepID=UPI0033CD8D60